MTPIARSLFIACCFLGLTVLADAPRAMGQSAEKGQAAKPKQKITIQPVTVFGNQSVVPGTGSVLTRTKDGVYMSLHSFGLEPGTAVTAWWVFFNNPEKCATTPCTPADLSNPEVQGSLVNATGRIVGTDGSAEFGAYRAAGDTTNTHTGSGLLNAFKAEIHVVVRTHGPAMTGDSETLKQQLSLFNGGCPPNTCVNVQASAHRP
jgi:hypothetical protein